MRKLIVIRIVHSAADMGSMGNDLEKIGSAKIGKDKWSENQKKIEKFWEEAESEIFALNLDYRRTRIYQDGLPCSGELGLKIVKETAQKGSKNYQIIWKLIEKGAVIEATESVQLLKKEFECVKAVISASTDQEKADTITRYDMIKDELIRQRDSFIAKVIDATLKENETGLLFIGAAHNVLPLLEKDIEVKSLD